MKFLHQVKFNNGFYCSKMRRDVFILKSLKEVSYSVFNIRISFHNLGHIFLIQCYFASTYFINIMIIHFIIIDKQYYEL